MDAVIAIARLADVGYTPAKHRAFIDQRRTSDDGIALMIFEDVHTTNDGVGMAVIAPADAPFTRVMAEMAHAFDGADCVVVVAEAKALMLDSMDDLERPRAVLELTQVEHSGLQVTCVNGDHVTCAFVTDTGMIIGPSQPDKHDHAMFVKLIQPPA